MEHSIDYRTHILVGIRANGVMAIIAHWPHVPRQTEVQQQIDSARDGYVTFALCTPTSILPVGSNSDAATGKSWPFRGR